MTAFIVALMAGGISALLVATLTGWSRGTGRATAEASASVGAQKIAQEIRDGQAATVSSGTLTVTIPQETVDGYGEACYNRGVAGQIREYYLLTNGVLMRRVDGVESAVVSGVSSATFTPYGASVTITITGQQQVGTSVSSETATARVRLRNHAAS